LAAAIRAAEPRVGAVVIEPAALKTPGGVIPFELGTLYVSENRAEAGSRVIGVGFARFKGRSPGP